MLLLPTIERIHRNTQQSMIMDSAAKRFWCKPFNKPQFQFLLYTVECSADCVHAVIPSLICNFSRFGGKSSITVIYIRIWRNRTLLDSGDNEFAPEAKCETMNRIKFIISNSVSRLQDETLFRNSLSQERVYEFEIKQVTSFVAVFPLPESIYFAIFSGTPYSRE